MGQRGGAAIKNGVKRPLGKNKGITFLIWYKRQEAEKQMPLPVFV